MTDRMETAAVLTRLVEVIDAHDWEGLPRLLHPDFECRLVHTGEVFGRDGWVRLNADYPGFEAMRREDLVTDGERGVLRASVTGVGADGERQEFAVAGFATVREGLVVELTEVWADVGQAPPPGTRPAG